MTDPALTAAVDTARAFILGMFDRYGELLSAADISAAEFAVTPPDNWSAEEVVELARTMLLSGGLIVGNVDDGFRRVVVAEVVADEPATLEDRILAAVAAGEVINVAALGSDHDTVTDALKRLSDEGRIHRAADGWKIGAAPADTGVSKEKTNTAAKADTAPAKGTPKADAAEPAKSGVPAKTKGGAPPVSKDVAKPAFTPANGETRTPSTPDMTPILVSIDQNVRALGQVLAMPQQQSREALDEGALLHVVLRRVMVLLTRHGALGVGDLTPLAYNKSNPAKRKMVPVALSYGLSVGALTRSGALYGGKYAVADPTRVGVARHELLNAAMRTPATAGKK